LKNAAIILKKSFENLTDAYGPRKACAQARQEGHVFSFRLVFLLAFSTLFVGCASGTFKARQEQREKMAASTGMYCEFISGDLFPDLDVELSMSMAKRCEPTKTFSITNYKNSSDQSGVIYCCNTGAGRRAASAPARKAAPSTTTPAKDDPSADVVPE
jgi:hypothetical protein